MTTSVLAPIGVLILAIALLVVGVTPLLFVPVFLVAGVLIFIPVLASVAGRTRFRRDSGAPSTTDASYDPVQRP
ncbi:MAG TPA: hypothetical protein VLA98_07665 [Solirubrobacteraceae bacterium]|nr:hypothetical protein [Solirubrobacteraceae bacterium]